MNVEIDDIGFLPNMALNLTSFGSVISRGSGFGNGFPYSKLSAPVPLSS